MKENLVMIKNRNQISAKHCLEFEDTVANTRSFMPNIIFSLDSIKTIYCDMETPLKSNIKHYLELPDFDPRDADIEVITEDGKPKYVQYSFWLKLEDDEDTYLLSKDEYQFILDRLGLFQCFSWTKAKYPTIEELKEYCKEKE